MRGRGSQRVEVRGSIFYDVAGSGIQLGDLHDYDEADAARQNAELAVRDCVLDGPVEFGGAPPIVGGYLRDSTIEHNWLRNLSYSGVSLGWGWGHTLSYAARNRVAANRIGPGGMTHCHDGGGVYTLGLQPGSEVVRNHVLGFRTGNMVPGQRLGRLHGGAQRARGPPTRPHWIYINYAQVMPGGERWQPPNLVDSNWVRSLRGAVVTCKNQTVVNTTMLGAGDPLPKEASDVVAKAGPRI